jgi:hypothetical protein
MNTPAGHDNRLPSRWLLRPATLAGMNWKLNPVAQQKLLVLGDLYNRVQRLHGLVEQYATAKANPAAFEGPIRRAGEQLKATMLGHGYGAMAQLAGTLVLAAKRNGAVSGKARMLREGVGSLRSQIEREQRALVAESRMGRAQTTEPE